MELYAVQYGKHFKYADYRGVYKDDNRTDLVPGFIFLYYIAKINDRIILFDTGFRNQKTADDYGIEQSDVMQEVNALTGGRADTIFITHAHFDHIDNLDLYPSAELVVSRETWADIQQNNPQLIEKRAPEAKLHVVDAEMLYDERFRFVVVGGHLRGSSVVYFDVGGKSYVIAGDEVYLCDNIERNIPNGNVCDSLKNARFIAHAHDQGIIPLPYHDEKIMKSYPTVSEHIVRII